ncbi:hypothetical protein CALVIDRAFT_600473 [Calocera viscosa TUFC12733]|uniref:Uncharacterized protein n=1 Tax=Calocera viscosa (strain TUFC12733) TaxID=1330018 RepID=A0A167JNQ6_CALVF|nr:hypothetical protein CALVIDRAFT_600473 [Calocera viscosa TUFC12733]
MKLYQVSMGSILCFRTKRTIVLVGISPASAGSPFVSSGMVLTFLLRTRQNDEGEEDAYLTGRTLRRTRCEIIYVLRTRRRIER